MTNSNSKKGFFQIIIILIIAIIIMKFVLDIDIIDFLKSDRFEEWFGYIKDVAVAIWEKVIKPIINLFKK
ncbi:MAG: hypothetical protein AAB726_03140 [Patescibacteria group bacterium]